MARIKVADLKRLGRMYLNEEISYSRMVEMLNEIAQRSTTTKEKYPREGKEL